MEFAVPISRFDPSRISWGEPRSGPFRKIIPFGYNENNVNLNNLILVLQPLRIVEIDWVRNHVVLEDFKRVPFLTKLDQLQSIILGEIESMPKHSMHATQLVHKASVSLQPWLKSKRLTLYLSSQPDTLPFFTQEGQSIFSEGTIKAGDIIRAIVKIQGVSLQMTEDDSWTGKSRIQHHILQLYKVSGE
jgi:hypothetical protein